MDPTLLSDCIHCGFCLPTCPTYQLWGEEMDSPRGRIYLMSARVDGTVTLNRTVVEHFDRCLGCMACVTACPSGVQYDRLIELTRARVEQEYRRPLGDRLLRSLIFTLFPYPRRMRAALALAPVGSKLPMPGLLRPLVELAPRGASREAPAEVTPAAGRQRARVGLLTGCVQRVVFGNVNAATARVLAADGIEVVAPRDQACCGALSVHAGRLEEGLARARRTIDVFERSGVDLVVTNAAGCGSNLKDYAHLLADDPDYAERAADFSSRVRDVSEVLAELGPRARRRPVPLTVAFQDSCHLAHAQGVRAAPRAMLRAIPELTVTEPADQEICCGSAGIYNIVEPGPARQLGDRKAEAVAATGAKVYASANPGCLLQVSAALRRAGHSLAAVHPIELVDASIRGVGAFRIRSEGRR